MRLEKTKIYLDTNVYNRPFDDQGQMRIRLEAEAFLSIMEKAASRSIIIIGSSALMYENSQNPFIERRERISTFLSIAANTVTLNDAIKNKALILQDKGIDAMDALHLAYAEAGWNALVKNIGLVNAARFILQYESGYGDYTKIKKEIFKGKTVNDLCKEIEKFEKRAGK